MRERTTKVTFQQKKEKDSFVLICQTAVLL